MDLPANDIEQLLVDAFVSRTVPDLTDKVSETATGDYIDAQITKGNMCNDKFQFDGRGWCKHMTTLLKTQGSKVTVTLLDDSVLFGIPEKYRVRMDSSKLNIIFFFAVNYEDNKSTINHFTRANYAPIVCINEEHTNSYYKIKK